MHGWFVVLLAWFGLISLEGAGRAASPEVRTKDGGIIPPRPEVVQMMDDGGIIPPR